MATMIELKVTSVGGGLGIELPKMLLEQLKTSEGENIFQEHMLNGSFRLAKHDEKFVETMMLIDGQMHEEDA